MERHFPLATVHTMRYFASLHLSFRHGIEAPSSSASCSIKDAVLKHGISHTVQTCAAALGHLGASERRGLYAPQQPVWVRDTPCSAAALGHTLAALSEAGCRDAIALLDDAACAATRCVIPSATMHVQWASGRSHSIDISQRCRPPADAVLPAIPTLPQTRRTAATRDRRPSALAQGHRCL